MSDLDLSKIDIETLKGSSVIAEAVSPLEMAIVAILAISIFLIALLIVKKTNFLKLIKNNGNQVMAIVSGWIIWCISVFSYAQLFDEYLNYVIWFTLPPLCTLLVFLWFKVFIINRKP